MVTFWTCTISLPKTTIWTMRQKKAFTSSDLIVRFVAPAFWRVSITFLSSFGELSYNIKIAEILIKSGFPLFCMPKVMGRRRNSFILPRFQLPIQRKIHGDKTCKSPDAIGNGFRPEHTVHAQPRLGQHYRQRRHDHGLAQQGKKYGLL